VKVALLAALAACGPTIHEARMSYTEPASDRELDAAQRVAVRSCSESWDWLFPGVAQACLHKPAEAAVLATLAAGELTTGITVAVASSEGTGHPGAGVPLVAVQDTWLYSVVDGRLDEQRAHHLRYVPQDTLAELALAPWNPRVLVQPDVVLGILGTTALGVGVSLLVDESSDTSHLGERPNLFGRTFSRGVGYPLAGAVGVGIFAHVSIAEETAFRGEIQSTLARAYGETQGWIWGSIIFGAFHATNIFFMPSDQRTEYLLIGVPFITVVGSWLGASYRWHHYSLAPSVAEHFWYDFLESAVFFALDPQHSPLSAGISIPF
jgi:membrane protease YdiL (CAAX protease family)